MENIYFFYGEDDYRLTMELRRWSNGFVEKHGDLGLHVLDGEITEITEVQNALEALPLLGTKKLVILKNIPFPASVRASKRSTEVEEKLVELLTQIDPETVVVFATSTPDKRKKLFKELNKSAQVRTFDLLKKPQLTQWIKTELTKRNAKASLSVITRLAEMVGSNLWQMDSELEKLTLYAENREITLSDLDLLVHKNLQESIFKLTDSLSSQNKKQTLQILHDLVDGGESLQAIFYMIVRQFRLIIMTKSCLENGKSSEIASLVGVPPFAVRGLTTAAQKFTAEQLRQIYARLLTIDTQLKTSEIQISADDNSALLLVLEKFLVEI